MGYAIDALYLSSNITVEFKMIAKIGENFRPAKKLVLIKSTLKPCAVTI